MMIPQVMHEDKTLQCQYCEYKATQKSNLARHIREHRQYIHEVKIFQCQNCEHRATRKGNLKRHIHRVYTSR